MELHEPHPEVGQEEEVPERCSVCVDRGSASDNLRIGGVSSYPISYVVVSCVELL